jgi:hypothetical protein
VKPQALYEALGAATLAIATAAGVLAATGVALQQFVSVAAATLCAVVFLVPGLYFLGYSRRLRSRELALAHTAAFVRSREVVPIEDLAEELHVSREVADRILRTALREGHVRGRFETPTRFVGERADPPQPRREP